MGGDLKAGQYLLSKLKYDIRVTIVFVCLTVKFITVNKEWKTPFTNSCSSYMFSQFDPIDLGWCAIDVGSMPQRLSCSGQWLLPLVAPFLWFWENLSQSIMLADIIMKKIAPQKLFKFVVDQNSIFQADIRNVPH